jgi:hypothetical protein
VSLQTSFRPGLAISRFAHVLGIRSRIGLGLIESPETSGKASWRSLLAADAEKVRDHMKQRRRLADVQFSCDDQPSFARCMLAPGEETAEMSHILILSCGTLRPKTDDRMQVRFLGCVPCFLRDGWRMRRKMQRKQTEVRWRRGWRHGNQRKNTSERLHPD